MATSPDPRSFLPLPHLPLHILLALASGEQAHGYAIIKRISEMPAAGGAPSSGSLYLAMMRLEDRGVIESVPAPDTDSDKRRRYYKLTGLGRQVLRAEVERLSGLIDIAREAVLDGSDGS